ncbi:HpcH/HpaI aldolase family protein [endosymbiont of Ridgeia piscesae]|uniref:2-keto-3-deoxy-L-rhamnonate aldolase RhmA n=1 Tax=endosymbiont of Ridgeia piscesae TaxID=54398 RepID=A0A0T5Z4W0_9GAMM|nr:aldolase/citrate lyase family protein [endosymbiont of Ridgeia piscesae]KRT55578.1 2-keto-3-deoxy-L-rhamnonate aldolase RhmA [endosymbiont of Ridgeia piscesae]KRT57904.1 4-hydroxy-2-oxoheptanedioate aldolase [endosymbiont of Ridgeia piscesae]
MRKNTIKEIWANGGAVVNGWCSIPSSFSAEVMAHQGFDSITIDMQHGVVDYQMAITMLQAISTTSVIPLTRVPWNDPARLMKILDAGSYGVICPMINNPDQAESLVAACKYPPMGMRSFGPIRAKYYAGGATHGGGDYHVYANDETLIIPQIETREAIENLDEILDVPGISAIYVGPSDLAMALGCQPRGGQNDPKVIEARQKIIETCKRHGIPAGIHTNSPEVAVQMIKDGFQLTSLASDDRFLMQAAKDTVNAVRSGIEQG